MKPIRIEMALSLLEAIKTVKESSLSSFAKHALLRGLVKEESELLLEFSNKQADLEQSKILNDLLL
jgi:hypothetical protein